MILITAASIFSHFTSKWVKHILNMSHFCKSKASISTNCLINVKVLERSKKERLTQFAFFSCIFMRLLKKKRVGKRKLSRQICLVTCLSILIPKLKDSTTLSFFPFYLQTYAMPFLYATKERPRNILQFILTNFSQ